MNYLGDITGPEYCYDLLQINYIHWSWSLFSLPTTPAAGYMVNKKLQRQVTEHQSRIR